ncbi:MAG: tetratricopeptide repeat protein [Pseudomonadota bacterium]|nr:tetratricopeptide repeat protein [Pseudomonadota bacterium]
MTSDIMNAAVKLHQSGDFNAARKLYESILNLDVHNTDALNLLGLVNHQLKDNEQALIYIEKAIVLNPDIPEYSNNLGLVLSTLGRLDEAESAYLCALSQAPEYADAHYNLGLLENKRSRYQVALRHFQKCQLYAPWHAKVRNGLALALMRLDRIPEALKEIEEQIEKDSEDVDAYNNLCVARGLRGEYALAREATARALELNPEHVYARVNRAQLLLLDGDFINGFAEHEWRLQRKDYRQKFSVPFWEGECRPNETIILWAEQGHGDAIQFIRYAQLVKERVGRVVISCRQSLLRLFSCVDGVDEVTVGDKPLHADCHAPLMSLPYIFKTQLQTIPSQVPYISVKKKCRFPANTQVLKVGLVWAGNPDHARDHRRSLPLQAFEPIFSISGVTFFSFQMGAAAEQLSDIKTPLLNISDGFDDFYDTACALSNVDLLITVDTSVAHLAGALGVPTWVILDCVPDWRWQLEREDTPWYPSLRLFRSRGEFSELMGRIAKALVDLAC